MRNAQLKTVKLLPNQAVAFSEKQFKRVFNLIKQLREQNEFNTQLYKHSENTFYTAIPLLGTSLPFAQIETITVEPDRIFASVESEAKPIREALKNNKSFRALLKKGNYPVWQLVWKYSFSTEEFEEIRKIKYPVFYVILNNSNQAIEIPV